MPVLAAVPPVLAVTVVAEAVGPGSFTAGTLGAVVAAAAVAYHVAGDGTLPRPTPVVVLAALLAALAVASLAWTVDTTATLGRLSALGMSLALLVAVAALVRTPRDFRRTAASYVGASVAASAWWAWSFATGADRFTNPAGDPNVAAMHLVMALPLALALAAGAPTALSRFGWRWAAVAVVVGTSTTLSRGGTFALAVTVGAIAVLPAGDLFRSRVEKRNVGIVTALALLVAVLAVGPQLTRRFSDDPAGGALGTRGHLWAAAVGAWSDQPATGLGFGGFQHRSYDLLSRTPGVDLDRHLQEELDEGRVVHNTYLEALAELGPAGLLLTAALLAAAVATAVRRARVAARDGMAALARPVAALAASSAGFAAASLFLSNATSRVLALVVGLLGSAAVVERAGARPRAPAYALEG